MITEGRLHTVQHENALRLVSLHQDAFASRGITGRELRDSPFCHLCGWWHHKHYRTVHEAEQLDDCDVCRGRQH